MARKKYKNYVDKSILVLTGKLNEQDKNYLKNENITVIQRSNIEKIGTILRKL